MEHDDMQQMKQDVAEIKRALLGSEQYQEVGLVRRVAGLEKWRESLTVKIALFTGGFIAVVWFVEKVVLK
jgi:hypothetical protein